jgi:hypothetical protein
MVLNDFFLIKGFAGGKYKRRIVNQTVRTFDLGDDDGIRFFFSTVSTSDKIPKVHVLGSIFDFGISHH